MSNTTLSPAGLSKPYAKPFPWRTVLLWLLLLPIVIVIAAPVWYMIAKAFTPEVNQYRFPIVWFPDPFTLVNFSTIMSDRALPIFALDVQQPGGHRGWHIAGVAGFVAKRLRVCASGISRPRRDLCLACHQPVGACVLQVIPTFLLMRDLGKIWVDLGLDKNPITGGPALRLGLDGYPALWLQGIAGAGTIFFLRQQFYGIPRELEDAAIVDGAGKFRVFWQVCLPLVKTAIVASGIGIALGFWNELFWALIMLSSREAITLPVGLLALTQTRLCATWPGFFRRVYRHCAADHCLRHLPAPDRPRDDHRRYGGSMMRFRTRNHRVQYVAIWCDLEFVSQIRLL